MLKVQNIEIITDSIHRTGRFKYFHLLNNFELKDITIDVPNKYSPDEVNILIKKYFKP